MRVRTAVLTSLIVLGLLAGVAPSLAGNDWEVFRITPDGGTASGPEISGDIVVWSDDRNGSWDIFGHNLATGQTFPICVADGEQVWPAISGSIVVWQDSRDGNPDYGGDVYGYDLSTGEEFVVYQGTGPDLYAYSPQVTGDWVIWMEYRAQEGGYGVYAHNLATHEEKSLYLGGSHAPGHVQAMNDMVVWGHYIDRDRRTDIFGYDLATDLPFTVCSAPDFQFYPATDGTMVVWQDRRKGLAHDMDIYGLDLATMTEFGIDTSSTDMRAPVVQGDLVIWTTGSDVYGQYLSSHETFHIAEDVHAQYPRISGNCIVWTTNTSGTEFSIFGARKVPEPSTLALLTMAAIGLAIGGWRRR